MTTQFAPDVVLTAFRKCFLWDATTSRPGSVADYQALFPGFEEVVAAEYERLSSEYPSADDARAAAKARVGPYQLDAFLGRGGQGAVYEATDTRDGRKVALKLLAGGAGMSEMRRLRLRREAEAIGRIDHPGICRIHEAGLDGDVPYLALHLVPGRTLSEAIGAARRERPAALGTVGAAEALALPADDGDASGTATRRALSRVCRFFEEAARAVHAAHEAGLVHRDVKPGNLMITPAGDPVVLDFGLARDEEEGGTITMTGALLGTPAYMAPEQIAPGAVRLDRRVDVYALGVSMFEALTLLHPFEAPTLEAAARLGDAKDLRQLDPRFPRDLSLILATAMRRDRDRRYVTALALAEDLRAFRLGRRIAARPPSVARRLGDWAARRPATAAASAVASVALVAGLAVSLHLLAETRDALAETTAAKEKARTAQERATDLLAETREALKQATAAKEAATKANAGANRLVEFMLGDLQKQLAAVGRTDLLVSVSEMAKKHFDSISMDDLSDAELVTVADAWSSLGMAYEKQSRRALQIECRERAREIRERLYAKDPHNPKYAERLADSLRPLGRLLNSYGRLDDAIAAFVRADGLTTGLPAELGESPNVRVARCDITLSLADFHRRFGRTDEMWAMLRRAAPIAESALHDQPSDVDALHQATRAVLATAAARDAAGESAAARELVDDALRRARAFVAAYPDEFAANEDVADALASETELAIDHGDSAAAESFTAESRDTCAELRKHDPRNARWGIQSIMANERTARALLAGGKARAAVDSALTAYAAASEAMKKSVEPQTNPEALTVISRVIRTYAAALRSDGSIDDALAKLDECGRLLAHAAEVAPQEVIVQLGIVLHRNELGATLGAAASRPGAASDLAARALAAFQEADDVARRVLAAHPDAVQFERQRAFILRDAAAVRRTTGDLAGAVAALEEAVRIRDGLAKKDAAFVARLADLDPLLADARKSAVISPSAK